MPAPHTLAQYDAIVPGAAERIISSHLRSVAVGSDAIERLSTAEARAVTVGALGAQVLTIGGLACSVLLIIAGYPAWAITVGVPAILSAAAQVLSAVRRAGTSKQE
jgi:uncharacterized membrane protein